MRGIQLIGYAALAVILAAVLYVSRSAARDPHSRLRWTFAGLLVACSTAASLASPPLRNSTVRMLSATRRAFGSDPPARRPNARARPVSVALVRRYRGNASAHSAGVTYWFSIEAYDSSGNTVCTAYHDSLGALMPQDYQLPQNGNWEFDDDGRVLNGCRIAFVKREFDDNCLYVSETNIGLCGEPVPDDQGRVVTLYEREIHGGISGSYWYGSHGEPVEVAGVWATRRTYNTYGWVTESSTWDSLDQPAEFPGGFASTRFSYTPSGNVEMISYYDLNKNPVINTVQGCHARYHYYDADGNLTEIQYLDTCYRPVNNSAGYARTVYTYDETGVKETHYDLNGSIP